MKKFVTAVVLFSLLCSLFTGIVGAAAVVPKLFLNGEQLETPVEPRYVGEYTMVPVRIVSEGLGFKVNWSGKLVTISDNSNTIVLAFDSKTAVVNDREVSLDAPAIVDKNTTLVPLRFVSEQLGLSVYWDKATQSVHLYQPEKPMDPEGPTDGNGSPQQPDASVLGTLSAITFDGYSSVYLPYSGEINNIKTQVLHNTERFVIDLPNTAFGPDFATVAGTKTGGEITIDTHPSFTKVRYSLFSDKPSTIRVVLDFNAETPVNIVREEGIIRLDVSEPTGPVVTPTDPNTNPNTPGTTDPEQPSTGQFKVVIDAGHGGKDPGASAVNGRTEKEFNLALALKVKALLDKEAQIQAFMTRSDDTFIELQDRAKIANDLKADIFISIHGNSATPAATGTETYYNRSDSKKLAEVMHKHLLQGTGLKDRKVKTAGFVVIKYTKMPAVLLEAGYLSNSGDAAVLYSEEKQNQIAREIVAGIKEYLKVS